MKKVLGFHLKTKTVLIMSVRMEILIPTAS